MVGITSEEKRFRSMLFKRFCCVFFCDVSNLNDGDGRLFSNSGNKILLTLAALKHDSMSFCWLSMMKDDTSVRLDVVGYEETYGSAENTKPIIMMDNKMIKCLFIIKVEFANIGIFRIIFQYDFMYFYKFAGK